jgi:hypothetical protein
MIIEKISEFAMTNKMSDFFDFLESFVMTHHGNFTQENLRILLKSLASRVVSE